MQTRLAAFIKQSSDGAEVESILRSCVHCGFCTATCPTYQLLGDERDSPRGRIVLMQQFFEGADVSEQTRNHLDRCLTCRSCETTCPSGVRYGRLIDLARQQMEQRLPRAAIGRVLRSVIKWILPHRTRFAFLFGIALRLRPLLPALLRKKVFVPMPAGERPSRSLSRKVLLLEGCVQPVLAPSINAAAARVLDRLGIESVVAPTETCCGALAYHLGSHQEGLDFMRANIDAWWSLVESGVEAIVSTASGCGLMVKEYAEVLRHDSAYAAKAEKISSLCRDLVEVLEREDLTVLSVPSAARRIACQTPCTLQHGQQLPGRVEALLSSLGFELTPVADSHLCCGSAGTYSLLQPDLSQQLLQQKLTALQAGQPEQIVTANIGCLSHLQAAAVRPVRHWVELLDPGD